MHKIYDPKLVSVTWNGEAITGFADDTFCVLRRNNDVVLETVGADGQMALTKNADMSGEIEITLMQTAKGNSLLSKVAAGQSLIGSTLPISNFTISDPSGSVTAIAANAYLKSVPDVTLGSDQNSKTWVFGCETMLTTDDLAGGLSVIGSILSEGGEILENIIDTATGVFDSF